mmetsp:Transcript_29786/g.70017  ORF Transcript_29786/g.70017 Transcript_29786/m.70017 type:complete len:221 (+) Transcript_29786:719-1381(+)
MPGGPCMPCIPGSMWRSRGRPARPCEAATEEGGRNESGTTIGDDAKMERRGPGVGTTTGVEANTVLAGVSPCVSHAAMAAFMLPRGGGENRGRRTEPRWLTLPPLTGGALMPRGSSVCQISSWCNVGVLKNSPPVASSPTSTSSLAAPGDESSSSLSRAEPCAKATSLRRGATRVAMSSRIGSMTIMSTATAKSSATTQANPRSRVKSTAGGKDRATCKV